MQMHDQAIGEFLADLADRVPAPGGGASAALHAAQAAALLAMVARYSDGARYAPHAGTIGRVLAEADDLRTTAVRIAADDAAAFSAVTDAYRLPKGTAGEQAARSDAIARTLIAAAAPPAELIDVAERLVTLAEMLLPIGNRNVISDVAAAAEAARAAATTAQVNVEINLRGITAARARQELLARAQRVQPVVARAEQITAAVRNEISA
jgi:formiminotetrahydrofolate cyclodeaminase